MHSVRPRPVTTDWLGISGPLNPTDGGGLDPSGGHDNRSAAPPDRRDSINECCTFRNRHGYNLDGPPECPPAPIARPTETHILPPTKATCARANVNQ